MSLKLYYSPGACSLAPHIALEEASVAYEPVKVALAKGEQRTPEYLAINPKGRVPVLAEDDLVLTENAAILPYIAQRFPEARLWPSDKRDAARTRSGSAGSRPRSISPMPMCAGPSATPPTRRRSRM